MFGIEKNAKGKNEGILKICEVITKNDPWAEREIKELIDKKPKESQWFNFINILIEKEYVIPIKHDFILEDVVYSLESTQDNRGYNFDFKRMVRLLSPDANVEEVLGTINTQLSKNFAIIGIINDKSNTYIAFVSSLEEFSKLKTLADSIGEDIYAIRNY